jgi:hypothetical protein
MSMSAYRRRIFVSIEVFAILIVSAGLCEIALHVLNLPPAPTVGWKWETSPYKSDLYASKSDVNQLGLRGRPINYAKDDFVVVLVGDSYVEAGFQPKERMPERVLEEIFKTKYRRDDIKVFSVASAGWGQDQEVLALSAYLAEFRADLVLTWLTPINDYWENGNIDRSVTKVAGPIKPTFDLRTGDIETPSFRSKLWLLLETLSARLHFGQGGTIEQLYLDDWLNHTPRSSLAPTSASSCPATEVGQLDVVGSSQPEITALTAEDVANGRSHFSHFIRPLGARELYQIDITHRLIRKARDVAKRSGAQFKVLNTFDGELDKALKRVSCVRDATSGDLYKTDFSDMAFDFKDDAFRDVLLRVNISTDKPTLVSSRDWHLNHEGNLVAMNALADRLMSDGLLKRAGERSPAATGTSKRGSDLLQ